MTMCPTYTFIDRANGKFNENMDFKREYAALISAAWEIDKAYDQYLSDIEGSEVNPLSKLGLISDTDEDALEERKKILKKIIELDQGNSFRKRIIGDTDNPDIDLLSMSI